MALALVASMAGLTAAELHCAFACRTADAPTAAVRSNCHETTADAATRLEGEQLCRDHESPAAAIEPSGAYRPAPAGVLAVARIVPPSLTADGVPVATGPHTWRPAARSAPSILRI
jgi:hypothetical protein